MDTASQLWVAVQHDVQGAHHGGPSSPDALERTVASQYAAETDLGPAYKPSACTHCGNQLAHPITGFDK